MGKFFDTEEGPCGHWQAWLDTDTDGVPTAQTIQQLTSSLSPKDREHLQDCEECRVAVAAWLSFRQSLRTLSARNEAPPWFAARVMAAIAAREDESRPLAARSE